MPNLSSPDAPLQLDPEVLEAIYTNEGQDLKHLTEHGWVLLVFLRQLGCTFCREALSDLSGLRASFEQRGVRIVFVHMSDDEIAEVYFNKYKLNGVAHISDPDLSLYEYFGLFKGSFWQLYGLKTWLRGLKAGLIDGHGLQIDPKLGNHSQMPGVFLLRECRVRGAFVHRSAADRPDYNELLDSCGI